MHDFIGIPRQLGRYELHERIGKGGMAQVYRATDTTLSRTVAVKVLHEHLSDDSTFKERFEQEAKFAANLSHPNIIQVFDFDTMPYTDGTIYYMVMPYIPGHTLREQLAHHAAQESRISPDSVYHIIRSLTEALGYAHKRGMVHRDIKPANVMFDEDGRVILTDFGIARLAEKSSLTQDGVTVGTPAYMAPEQAAGEAVDARSDLYALGVILYELLSGSPPFDDESSLAVMMKHLNEAPPPLSHFIDAPDPAVEAVVMKALAKPPAARYQDADAMIHDLKIAFTGGDRASMTTQDTLQAIRANRDIFYTPYPRQAPTSSDTVPTSANTLVMITRQLQTITRSPLGIFAIGLTVLGVMLAVGLVQSMNSRSDPGVDSMTGGVDSFYFSNDFNTEDPLREMWQATDSTVTRESFTDAGEYRLDNDMPGRAVTSLFDPSYQYGEATIIIQGRLTADSATSSAYGIVFRYLNEDNYHVFAVDGEGRYSIWIRQNGVWRELRDTGENWTSDARINPLGENNRLALTFDGDQLMGFVNSQLVTSVQVASWPMGAIGLYLATPTAGTASVLIERYGVSSAVPSMTDSIDDPMFPNR